MSTEDKSGHIYILSNASMPGLLKIGFTQRDVKTRARELSRSSGVPTDFVIEGSIRAKHARGTEKKIHLALDRYRVSGNREFFKIEVDEAKRVCAAALKLHKAEFMRQEGGRRWQGRGSRSLLSLRAITSLLIIGIGTVEYHTGILNLFMMRI